MFAIRASTLIYNQSLLISAWTTAGQSSGGNFPIIVIFMGRWTGNRDNIEMSLWRFGEAGSIKIWMDRYKSPGKQ